MCPPAADPLIDIDHHCTNEELIMHLLKLQLGASPPRNVITGVNPYCQKPEALTDESWYFVRSEERRGTEDGFWEPKGEPARVFFNKSISGWRTTSEFFEGKTPHSRKKTDWVLQEFKLTPNKSDQDIDESKAPQQPCLLCRVFRSSEDLNEQGIDSKNGGVDPSCGKSLSPTPFALVINTDSRFEKGSTSNHQDDDHSKKGIAESLPDVPVAENIPDNDVVLRGDFLELWDLENPGSPSSSSDNSSCVTVSSDERFDSLALLQDLEPAEDPNMENRDTNFNLATSASNHGPDRIVAQIATSGSLVIDRQRNLPDQGTRIADPSPPSSSKGKEKKRECSPGKPSPDSCEDAPSASGQSSDSEGGSRKGSRRSKRVKNKFLCFLPFQFLV